jgi:hypothetical protein
LLKNKNSEKNIQAQVSHITRKQLQHVSHNLFRGHG